MWNEVFGLALLAALNPMLIAFILLVISRPRPLSNLLAFWFGCLSVNVVCLFVPLLVVHLVPSFAAFAERVATPDAVSGIQPLQTGTGVFALAVALVLAVRMWGRKPTAEPAPVGAGTDTLVLEPEAEEPTSWLRARSRQLVKRAQAAWEGGSLWLALLFGLAYVPPIPLVLLVVTNLAGSGASIAAQYVVALVFVLVMLALVEVALVSHLIAPQRTRAALSPLHDWARTHRLPILFGLLVVVGIWQLVVGLGLA